MGDFTKSIAHLNSALNLFQSQDDEELGIQLMIDLAESYNGARDYGSAMDLCQQLAILLAKSSNVTLQAKFLHLRGIIYRDRGQPDEAKGDLQNALQLYDQLGDSTHLGNAKIDLGNVYYYQNQFEEAAANYREALKSFEAQRDARGILTSRFNIADILLQEEQYQAALDEIQPAVELAHQRKFPTLLELKSNLIFVEALIALLRLEEAEQELNALREPIKKLQSPCVSGQELSLVAFKLSKQNHVEQAMNDFVRAFELLGNPGCEFECGRGYLLFAGFLRDQGNFNRAEQAVSKAKTLFTHLNNELGLQAAGKILPSGPDQ
jgi:tetratricopeptide (TPR) repeat protein